MRFAWNVCGEPHADFVLDRLTPTQYAEIVAFAKTEPTPDAREDLRAAMQCLITARAAGSKHAKLEHFLDVLQARGAAEEGQTQEEMDREMQKLAALFEASERRRERKHGQS